MHLPEDEVPRRRLPRDEADEAGEAGAAGEPAGAGPERRQRRRTGLPPDTVFLVRDVQARPEGVSLENLVEKVRAYLIRTYQRREIPAPHGLDDLVQDVTIEVIEDIGRVHVDERSSFWKWVHKIAENKLTDIWRRENAQKRGGGRRVPTGSAGDDEDRGVSGLADIADQKSYRQSMWARLHELEGSMREASDKLKVEYRQVIRLRMFEALPFAEIARVLGCRSETTARALFTRALAKLRAGMGFGASGGMPD